jgi:hypothetical protein
MMGILVLSTTDGAYKTNATLAAEISGITDDLPEAFPTYQWWSKNEAIGEGQAVYNVDGSPALVINTAHGQRAAFWDPPEFSPQPWFSAPLREKLGGSAIPYVLVARVANSFLAQVKALHASEIDPNQAVAVESWGLKNGEVRILAGNLEDGLRDDADLSRHTSLVLPWENYSLSQAPTPGNSLPAVGGNLEGANLQIRLGQAETTLLTLKPAR